MHFVRALAALLGASLLAMAASAQPYPSRPIKFVVGYSAGGGTDVAARLIADELGKRLNTSVVVENREGASGTVAALAVVRAPKDGYTLLFGASPEMSILPATRRTMPYDVRRDLVPISLVGITPLVLAVPASSPARSVAELVAAAKQQPGRLNYASTGAGGSNHLAAELFKIRTGTDIVHVPYKGGAAAMPDFLAGRVQMMFHSESQVLPLLNERKLRVLAYASQSRSGRMPDVPTLSEAGVPGFAAGSWFGVLAPVGTPPEIVSRLGREIAAVVALPRIQKLFGDEGTIPASPSQGTPDGFAQFIEAQTSEISEMAKRAGISLD
jgi:tripartite-type tricarboxylate transporter receptor subunit TctC